MKIATKRNAYRLAEWLASNGYVVEISNRGRYFYIDFYKVAK